MKEWRGSTRNSLKFAVLQTLLKNARFSLEFDKLDKQKAQEIMDTVGNGYEFENFPTYSEILEMFRKEFKGFEVIKKEIPVMFEMLEFARDHLLASLSVNVKFGKYLLIAEAKTAGL
mmetsp:Transcript_7808/g.7053  ORF Transcript_7808/g.7053 Transcript_7808/m.7053 type:complete len:117 (+) Transcript_7808:1041-1391(+)